MMDDVPPLPEPRPASTDKVGAKSPMPKRTRHSVCVHCGYYLEGTPIVDGAMRCPECGELSTLTLEHPQTRGDRGLGCLLIAGLVLLAIGIPVAFMVPAEWRLIGGLAAAVIVLAVMPRALRRVFDV